MYDAPFWFVPPLRVPRGILHIFPKRETPSVSRPILCMFSFTSVLNAMGLEFEGILDIKETRGNYNFPLQR